MLAANNAAFGPRVGRAVVDVKHLGAVGEHRGHRSPAGRRGEQFTPVRCSDVCSMVRSMCAQRPAPLMNCDSVVAYKYRSSDTFSLDVHVGVARRTSRLLHPKSIASNNISFRLCSGSAHETVCPTPTVSSSAGGRGDQCVYPDGAERVRRSP